MNELIERGVRARLEAGSAPSLLPVINATGVVIHTNLGRAPLSHSAATAAATLARGYTNLEYDLDKGARGRRDVHAEPLICRLTKAEAAVVVNNNAAAALLVLAALASGGEVIISRGELVEIGGGFRVPDVMTQSGATLREVIDDLDRQHPGLKDRILDGDMIRGDTMLAVNADEAQDLDTPVPEDAEVHILPSIAGG